MRKKKQFSQLQAKKKQLLRRKTIMQILHFVLSVSPLIALLIVRREIYFTYKEGLSVSVGLILAGIAAFLLAKKEFKFFNGVWKFVIIFVICYFLDSVMKDAVYISGAILIGYLLSMGLNTPILRCAEALKIIRESEIKVLALSEIKFHTQVTGKEEEALNG